jgi:hypothetical protein
MKLTQLTIALGLASTLAWGNEHLTQIHDQAAQLERQYRDIGAVVKTKTFNPSEVQSRLDAASAGVETLKQLVSDAEAAKAIPDSHAEWQKTKTLVALIEVYHNNKSTTLADDPGKKRTILKRYAEGLVTRSSMLQQSSKRLLNQLGAGS